MATKLARMVIYLDRLLLIIKSYKALIMWSCKVTRQTKTIISLLQDIYGNQTWQNDSFPWWASTYNVVWPFDNMALWDTRFTYRRKFSTQTLKSSPISCCNLYIARNEEFQFIWQKLYSRELKCYIQHEKVDLDES